MEETFEKSNKTKYKEKIVSFLKNPIIYLVIIIAIVQSFIYANIPEVGHTGDSGGYLYAYDKGSFFNGYLDEARPPIYSYFIKVIKKIGGEANLESNVVLAQKILFLVSVILFYYILKLLIKNKIIIVSLTLIFGLSPSMFVWNTYIVTEAIVGIEMVFLAFITIKYLKKPSKILASFMGIIVLAMILTKPALIYLLPIYILFIILRFILNKEERKKLYFAIGSMVICCVCLIVYCLQMKNLYGVFGITAVSYNNTVLSAIISGAYVDSDNEQIKNEIKGLVGDKNPKDVDPYSIFDKIKQNHSSSKIEEFANSASKSTKYKTFVLNRFIKVGTENIGTSYSNGEKSNKEYIYNYTFLGDLTVPITFGMLYIILFISIIYLIWYLIKYKKINWICAFFTSTIFANIFTLIVGAPFEEQRLFFPSMCLVILYVGVIIDKIKLKEENLLNEKNV